MMVKVWNENLQGESDHDSIITKADSKLLKGVAILMMVSMHLMRTDWMNNPGILMDIQIQGEYLSHILAQSIHASTAIFAFLTGYTWGGVCGYKKKSPWKRILSLYMSYWLVTLIINLPFTEINAILIDGQIAELSVGTVIKCVVAFSSALSNFSWYVLFFALAVITYPAVWRFFFKIAKNGYLRIFYIIIIFLGLRLIFRVMYGYGVFGNGVLNVLSRYCTTMPSLVIGSTVYQCSIFEHWKNRMSEKKALVLSILLMVLLVTVKGILLFVLDIDSGLESIWIVLEMFAILTIVRAISKLNIIRSVLSVLGEYSLYIWLIHAVFILSFMQPFTYVLKIPILVVSMVLIISLAVGVLLKKIDSSLKKFIF